MNISIWYVWIPVCILALIIAYIISKKEARPYYIIFKKESGITDEDITLYLTYSEYDDGSEEGFVWTDDEGKAHCFDSFEEAREIHEGLHDNSTILKV